MRVAQQTEGGGVGKARLARCLGQRNSAGKVLLRDPLQDGGVPQSAMPWIGGDCVVKASRLCIGIDAAAARFGQREPERGVGRPVSDRFLEASRRFVEAVQFDQKHSEQRFCFRIGPVEDDRFRRVRCAAGDIAGLHPYVGSKLPQGGVGIRLLDRAVEDDQGFLRTAFAQRQPRRQFGQPGRGGTKPSQGGEKRACCHETAGVDERPGSGEQCSCVRGIVIVHRRAPFEPGCVRRRLRQAMRPRNEAAS